MVLFVAESDPRLVAFGKRLRAARKAAGLTQSELAERASIHRVSVARFEAGKVDPSFTTVVRLAEVIGISPAALSDDPG